jgi:zinc protease
MRRRDFLAIGLTGLAGAGVRPGRAWAQTVTRTKLPNGFTLLVRENPTAPVVGLSLIVRLGTRWETRDDAGICNLLQFMVVRGTEKMDGSQIVEAADRMGGSIDAWGDVDASEISATALARHSVEILDLVADVALTPTLPAGTTEAVRDFIINQIRNRADKPYDVAVDTMLARLYGDHPYAWSPLGRRESVERITRDAMIARYRRHFVPTEMFLAVSGRVRAQEVLAQVAKRFGDIPTGPPPPLRSAPIPPLAVTREALEVPGAQAQILAGSLAPTMTEPDYAPVKVLSTVLGGGMAGRFFSDLRDKQGLAYTTGVIYPTRVDRGFIQAQLGTAPENVDRAEAALGEQLARIRGEPVSAEELRVAKAYLLGNLAMDRRTNARQAWYLATFEALGVGHEFLDRYIAAVKAVSAADVQRVAGLYLGTLRTVVVRPPKP